MHIAVADRQIMAATSTSLVDLPDHEVGPLSPVIDRPDRRMSITRRVRNYAGRARFKGSLLRACTGLVAERVTASWADLREGWSAKPRILQVLAGADTLAGAGSVAIFVHYAPKPEVSAMVLQQLRAYRSQGFRIVFVSMAPALLPETRAALTPLVARIVLRRNIGLDFGAWQDVLALLDTDRLSELLLANDSVCGPVLPMSPVFDVMRSGGPGLFGLTENLAPRPHLQSYLLLARGGAAIADMRLFLRRYRQTASKRAVVRTGEVALSGWMRRRGHLVAACFGYEAVEREALETRRAQRRLTRLFPLLFAECATEPGADLVRGRLQHYPLNPAHSLWFELVESCGFPFIKTELLLRNPIGIPDLSGWRMLVSPAELPVIEAHLRMMRTSA